MNTNYIGQPTRRVDGRAKVTGEAKYAAEFNVPDLLYGVVISSTICKGKITQVDASAALKLPGVLQVYSHENSPNTAWLNRDYKDMDSPAGKPFRPLQTDEVMFSGQPVALVVADTFELARYAATLVEITYTEEEHKTDLYAHLGDAKPAPTGKTGFQPPPKPKGDPEKAFQEASVQHQAIYLEGVEHHNPMEMFASTVVYEDNDKLTVYDKTQGVMNTLQYLTKVFGYSKEQVRVISPFVGGAFGSGLRPQYQLYLAVLAARELKRSVRVSLTRQQMFTFGHRPSCFQKIALGADADGKLKSLIHEAYGETSQFEDYTEVIVNWSGMQYESPNIKLDYLLTKLDNYTPLDMRAPGAVTGLFALEIAMDELAYKVGIDPIELRLRNYAEKDPSTGKPWSSNELRECYRQGAERFGWEKRNPEPRSMKNGHTLTGWGMASGIWDAMQQKAQAHALLTIDGKLTVSSATSDIGTGTYTIMTQIAAETLGLHLDQVTFKLGDTNLPEAPLEGGSWTAASVGTAVQAVCDKIAHHLYHLARHVEGSPIADANWSDVILADGKVCLKSDREKGITIMDAMRHGGVTSIEETIQTGPDMLKQNPYARTTHSAVFAEVEVDEEFGTVRVTRVVSAIAAGRILNPQTARSQVLGAVVWGISMALHEESVMDHRLGRFMNHNLAEYHIPVNKDIQEIDVIFVPEKDDIVNPMGVKGVGEIGIVGVAAAISNAIFHATGKRVRELPFYLDRVREAESC